MAEITAEELAEYEQLKAIRKQTAAAVANGGEPGPDQLVKSRAFLADGSSYDYVGGHPTHVDNGAGRVPVSSWYNLPV
jgi:hypothetical protein